MAEHKKFISHDEVREWVEKITESLPYFVEIDKAEQVIPSMYKRLTEQLCCGAEVERMKAYLNTHVFDPAKGVFVPINKRYYATMELRLLIEADTREDAEELLADLEFTPNMGGVVEVAYGYSAVSGEEVK